MYVITFRKGVCVCMVGGGVCGDGIGNMCDLEHIWSHTQGGERYISAHTHTGSETHTHTHAHEALINLAVLAAAGPDFVPAKTDVGGSSTFSQSALIAGLRSPASLARCLSALYLPVRFDERLPRVGAAAPRRPAFCFGFCFFFYFPVPSRRCFAERPERSAMFSYCLPA